MKEIKSIYIYFILLNVDQCKLLCFENSCEECNSSEYGQCTKCKETFTLVNGSCPCFEEKCSLCSYGYSVPGLCQICKYGYRLNNNGKCDCDDKNCKKCSKNICIKYTNLNYDKKNRIRKLEQCNKNCFYNISTKSCECKDLSIKHLLMTIFIPLTIIILIIVVVCCYLKRRYRSEIENEEQNIVIINYGRGQIHVLPFERNNTDSSRSSLLKDFEIQKIKMQKVWKTCSFCNKSPGKYISDCGCILCEKHSRQKEIPGNSKNKNNLKICFNCGKIVQKVTPRDFHCQICFQEKKFLVHFKCNCSLEVCKDCFIKCKLTKKCPACRGDI